jgi:hypothetical protein
MPKPITMTVYLFAEDDENPHKWNVGEWLDDPTVCGWEITDGHGACAACEFDTHEEV